jgi:hypothetical protein
MKTPDDPDSFGKGLGKKVTPQAKPAEYEWERFTGQHGDRLERNKLTGAIRSAEPRLINVEPLPPIYTTEQWDAIRNAQEEDGYPNIYWGTF